MLNNAPLNVGIIDYFKIKNCRNINFFYFLDIDGYDNLLSRCIHVAGDLTVTFFLFP